MKISVICHPNSRQEKIIKHNTHLEIWVTQPAIDNKANKAVIEALSAYYNVPKSSIRLIKGITNKNKIFEIVTF